MLTDTIYYDYSSNSVRETPSFLPSHMGEAPRVQYHALKSCRRVFRTQAVINEIIPSVTN